MDTQRVKSILKDALESRKGPVLLQTVCDILVGNVTRYSWVGIYMLRDTKLHLDAWQGPSPTEHAVIDVGQGICGAAAREGRTVIVDDVNADPRYLSCFASTRSEIVVPIERDGRVVGEIDIDGDEPGAFSDEDSAFLEWLAGELGRRL